VSAQVSAQANRHLFTLTVLTTLLLPPSLVTGYFGMNTKNLLFSESDYGTVFATLIVVGAALSVYLLMRRNRMLQ
jgi:zinc transporter